MAKFVVIGLSEVVKRLAAVLITSLAVAVADGIFLVRAHSDPRAYNAGLMLAATWIFLLIYALARFGKRGLWLIVGAPPVLFWVYWLVALMWSCGVRHNCL